MMPTEWISKPCRSTSGTNGFCKGSVMKLSLAISKAIKSINANYKDGENGFETEIFGMFGTGDFKEGTTAFGEKQVFYGE
jgi:enoyl-CoA hydratase